MNFQKIIFIALGLLFIFSCSKEKDEEPPVIVIDSPTHLQNINSGDTLQILGTISDDKNVQSVRIVLKDNNNINALSTASIELNSPTHNLNVLYFFDDIHMETGTYHFNISATDGENTTTKFIEVFVSGVPKTREGVFIYDNVASTTSIFRLDNTFNATLFKSFSGDFLGGAANSYYQQLISTGSATGKASVIDPEFGFDLWDIPLVNSPPTPYFTSIFFNDKTTYLGYYNGDIKGYNSSATSSFSAQSVTGFYCESGFVHEEFLVTEQVDITHANFRFGLYYLTTGAQSQQFSIFEDICGMYSFTPNEIVLLSNDASNNGKLSFFNISASGFSSPFSIGTGKIDACEEVGSGLYLIARNGDIRLVNANNFTTQLYVAGANATFLKYDEFTNELFVVSGNSLTVYDYSSKVVKGIYAHSSPILDVQLMYNK